jgi:uncharacterized protein YifN (PemK superfamily)
MPRLTTKRSLVPKINRKAQFKVVNDPDNSFVFSDNINKWIKGRRLERVGEKRIYRWM